MTTDSLPETMEAMKKWHNIFKCSNKRTFRPEFYIQQKYPSGMKEKSTFSGEEKLTKIVSIRTTLKEWLRKFLKCK